MEIHSDICISDFKSLPSTVLKVIAFWMFSVKDFKQLSLFEMLLWQISTKEKTVSLKNVYARELIL